MKREWKEKPFEKCVDPLRINRSQQIKSSEYLLSGQYPIVDQGQKLIAGWTDNRSALVGEMAPCIIFGDHTRIFKYIDFPFALGADGTKLFKAKDGINPRYLYFALLVVDIPSRGYSRHYGLLKEKSIAIPPLPEQEKIAAVLLNIQQAIETQDRMIQALRDLKKSTLQHVFTRGLRGEKTKMTAIGEIPESWEVVKLDEVCTFLSGGTPTKARHDYWQGTIPWVSPKDMKTNRLREVKDRISQAGLDEGSCLAPQGALFIVVRGMILVKDVPIALAEVPMAFNQDMKALVPSGRCDAEFMLYALQAFKSALFQKVGRSAHGTRTIVGDTLATFRIPLAGFEEQKQIGRVFEAIERKMMVHESKKTALQSLFKTALNKLMSGEIRVGKLEIEMAEVAG